MTTMGPRAFLSFQSAVLKGENAYLFEIAQQIKKLDLSLKEVHALIEMTLPPNEIEKHLFSNSTWKLATTYAPEPCQHLPRLLRPASGCLTEVPDVYVDVEGQPTCMLCGAELDWCPRCCQSQLLRRTYPRHTSWRERSAEVVAMAGEFNILENRVLLVRECRACGFAEISSTDDAEAYML